MDWVWGVVSPPKSGGRIWGYNLKLISTLHNDSIPEKSSGKKWGGHVHPSAPRGNAHGCKVNESARRNFDRFLVSCWPGSR